MLGMREWMVAEITVTQGRFKRKSSRGEQRLRIGGDEVKSNSPSDYNDLASSLN